MTFTHNRFGEITYDESSLLTIPEGLVGFENFHRFSLISDEETEPFVWLVSLEDADLAWPLVNPLMVVSDYDHDLTADQFAPLELENEDDLLIFVIVTLREELEQSTVNLKAPMLINHRRRRGLQVILKSDDAPVSHPLF